MALKLNLFVHGVPKGQKIWGPQEDDRIFIESFYSIKSNLEEQLKIDIIKIGVDTYCYYTYMRGGNMLDTDNRQGSYFALTIRINAFYSDLKNMYDILDNSYQKFVLGKILIRSDASSKYLIDDFQQCDDTLKSLEKAIINHLSTFSNNSDFLNLDSFAANSKLACSNIYYLECNTKDVFNYLKEKGSVSVSPLHPSRQFLEYTSKKEEELNRLKQEAQKQIGEEKRKSEQQIQSIKAEYATADKRIAELNKQFEEEKLKTNSLNQKIDSLEKEYNKIKPQDIKKPDSIPGTKNLISFNVYLLLITVLLTLSILLAFAFFLSKQSNTIEQLNSQISTKFDVFNNKLDELTKSSDTTKKTDNKPIEAPQPAPVISTAPPGPSAPKKQSVVKNNNGTKNGNQKASNKGKDSTSN